MGIETAADAAALRDAMTSLILQDAALRPELFDWRGPIAPDLLQQWLRDRALRLPSDLVRVRQATGGGEMFESESLLAPFGEAAFGDDFESINAVEQRRGLPSGYRVFHIGMRRSAVRESDGTYAVFSEDSFEVESTYIDFEQWYEQFLRDEYAGRYGLPKAGSR